MKLFSIASVGLAAVVASEVARSPRQADFSIELSGEETTDQIIEIITQIAGDAKDEVDEAIQAVMGDTDRSTNILQLRKFQQLKMLTLWVTKEQKMGRFCYYGCYCHPEGTKNIATSGYGKPIDNIDAACFDYKKCYKCLIDEFQGDSFVIKQFQQGKIPKEECNGEYLGYSAVLTTDASGKRTLECENPVGSCRRSICECDKRLALSFAKYEDEWDVANHQVKGGFNREDQCFRPQVGTPFEECCGDKTTFPFNQPRHEGQCCSGPEALQAGEC